MRAHPGPLAAPVLGPSLRVGHVDEGLAGEEAVAHERYDPLNARLVLWGPHPGWVNDEPPDAARTR